MKKNRIWKLIIFAVLLVCLQPMIIYAKDDTKTRTVRVGCPVSLGYYSEDENGEIGGYGFEYDQILSQYTGWNMEYVTGTWTELNQMLRDGEIDMLGFLIKTDDRQQDYLYADKSSGTSMSCLITLKEDEEYTYNDYEEFDGMTVGYQISNRNEDAFHEWTQKNGFSTNNVACESTAEVLDNLDKNEIDAALLTNFTDLDDYNVIATFLPRNFYYAVSKGNETLLGELNTALEKIDIYYPNIENSLYGKYYDKTNGHKVGFTEEELQYLQNNPVVKIVIGGRGKPFEYYNEKKGIYEGIIPDVLKEVSEVTGIEFEYVVTKDRWSIKDSEIDGNKITTCTSDFSWAKKNCLLLTQPFLEGNVSVLTKHANTNIQTVGLVENQYLSYIIEKTYPAWNIENYSSVDESFEALQKGAIDATIINCYEADYYLSMGKYSMLHEDISSQIPQDVCFAVTEDSNPMLVSILSKAILMVDKDTYQSILSRNIIASKSNRLTDLIFTNPSQFIGLIIVMTALLAVTIMMLAKERVAYRLIRKMSTEDGVTELLNRNVYEKKIEKEVSREFAVIGCIYIDVNGLHEYNNKYGHLAGDKKLKRIADCLKEKFTYKCVYRVGGDEFVILLENTQQEQMSRDMHEVENMIGQDGYAVSYGIEYREKEIGLSNMIRLADEKMLENKKQYYASHSRREMR